MGKILKGLVKFSVAAAAVGGVCYAFRDKIRDSDVYREHNVDEKINKVKTTIKEKLPKVFDNEKDYVEDDELFFDDLDFESEAMERDYVTINSDSSQSSSDSSETSAFDTTEDIPIETSDASANEDIEE